MPRKRNKTVESNTTYLCSIAFSPTQAQFSAEFDTPEAALDAYATASQLPTKAGIFLFKSDDGGQNWQQVTARFPPGWKKAVRELANQNGTNTPEDQP